MCTCKMGLLRQGLTELSNEDPAAVGISLQWADQCNKVFGIWCHWSLYRPLFIVFKHRC